MPTDQFFQIASGITLLLINHARFVNLVNYEDKGERVFFNVWSVSGVYRLELNHQVVNHLSTLKVRLYEGTKGAMLKLQPRLDRLNKQSTCKWEHYAGTITAVGTFRFTQDGINQATLEPVLAFIEQAISDIAFTK